MKRVIFLAAATALWAKIPSECELYFKQNQSILDAKTRQADEARQELESFKAAFLALQEQKKAEMQKKEKELAEEKKQLDALKKQIENEKLQIASAKEEIKDENIKKVALSYSKMKDAAAAAILEQMSEADALQILKALEAKKIASVLPKMSPEKAASLSVKLSKIQEENSLK